MAQTLFDLLDDPEAAAFAPAFAKDKRRKPSNIDVLNAGIAGIGDLAYDAAGFPVDLSAGLMRALGFDVGQTPMSSDWLKSKATNLGIRPPESADPTLRDVRLGAEMMSGGIDPYATAKGIGMVGSTVAREAAPVVGNALEGYMARSGLAPRAIPESPAMPQPKPTAPVSPAGFYSATEQAALNLPRSKGQGQALISDLLKSPDVKRDELQAMGLLDAFANKPEITKQELIDYIGQNKVELESKVLSSKNPYPYRTADEWRGAIEAAERSENWDEAARLETAWEQSEGQVGAAGRTLPRYESYSLPGGKNYQETLLTLPQKEPAIPAGYKVTPVEYDDGTVRYFAETPTTRSAAYKTETEAQSELQRSIESLKSFRDNQTAFKSSHWDEPNVMAHLRTQDFVDADGKNMRLIEEVQSDWHQAGREKGYKSDVNPEENAALVKQWDTLAGERRDLERIVANGDDADPAVQRAVQRLNDLSNELNAINDKLTQITTTFREGVPDAPMKETWYQTALRKAVKDAIDAGQDRVGITTGTRQAERYGQIKKINEIKAFKAKEDGTRLVGFKTESGSFVNVTIDADGKIVAGQANMVQEYIGKPLEKMIGKDAASKVVASGREESVIPSKGVSIGGKGMKKYYDEVYPKYLEKFAKKYGATVKEGSVRTSSKDPVKVSQVQGWDLGGMTPEEFVKQYNNKNNEPVRYIDITPEMRKAFGGKDKGVPLFQAAPLIPVGIGAGGLLDQFGERQQ